MRPPSLPFAFVVVLACAAPPFSSALAQSAVGQAVIEGRGVTLFDDMTWAYTDSSAGCDTIAAGLEFCGAQSGWKPSRKPTADYATAYRLNDRLYGGFIIENVGTEQGITPELARSLILEIPESTSGSAAVILDTQPVSIGGQNGETLVYSFTVKGVDVVYANSFVLGVDQTLQLLTYEIGTSWSDAHRAAHAGFVAATRYNAD